MPERRANAFQKRLVAERANGCCEYCRCPDGYSTQSFSIEHIIPFSRGGETHVDNLAYSCQGCNNRKYDRFSGYDPIGRKPAALFHPRKQQWREHFAWNPDFSFIIGLTPTGRATVEALQLNREGVVNLRRALYIVGKHPPVEE